MKTTICFCFFSILAFAQPESSSIYERRHEFTFGAVKLLAGPIVELNYEYIFREDFTFGTSILVNGRNDNDWEEDFSVTPFARFYFQERKEFAAKGFFVEGFAKYSNGRNNDYGNENKQRYNAASLGLAGGFKLINRTGFVLEIVAGGGRTLGESKNAPDFIFRGDINLGYRF